MIFTFTSSAITKIPRSHNKTIINGWLYSGDIGELDEGGYLRITDRKKDINRDSRWKECFSPAYRKLKMNPLINDAVIIGDKRKCLTALIKLDEYTVVKYA